MCKYCSEDGSMDVLDKSFFDESIDVGVFGVLIVNGRVYAKRSCLEFSVITDTGEAKVYRKDIKVCPFCGRTMEYTADR
ncbi:hypothetical protein [Butyrivibrio sp. MB2005]|uniref:hypothetical protein n=1 Tax=Butyrivibrio sp. MB2005 TaxID=1280678 RepID=UPI0003FD9622|nr:hypothetical protein [Butyrivibrio sp. MB2005]